MIISVIYDGFVYSFYAWHQSLTTDSDKMSGIHSAILMSSLALTMNIYMIIFLTFDYGLGYGHNYVDVPLVIELLPLGIIILFSYIYFMHHKRYIKIISRYKVDDQRVLKYRLTWTGLYIIGSVVAAALAAAL